MEVQIFSDLHIEFYNSFPRIEKYANILILAGDIGKINHTPYINFLSYVSNTWSTIIYVLGNHEFYHSKKTYYKLKQEYKALIRENFRNIFLLDNDYIFINNYLFIGSTLWSYYNTEYPDDIINCVTKIKYKDINGYTKSIGKEQYNEMHYNDKSKLYNILNNIGYYEEKENNENNENINYTDYKNIKINKETKIVLVTHYPIHNKKVSNPMYSSEYDSLFSNDLLKDIINFRNKNFKNTELISICGHTHYSFYFKSSKKNISFISNQCGYKDEVLNNMSLFNDKGYFII